MSKVAIIMGSVSDMPVMKEAVEVLTGFGIEIEVDIVSAQNTR
jgi:5-(carboxyamino)imidazole ribonucleotide mutase